MLHRLRAAPRRTPRRATALAATFALLAGVTGCGGGGGTSTPGPGTKTAATAPDLGFAITPSAYGDPYSGALDAAAQAPALAQVLARGIATADKKPGDLASPASDLAAQLTALLATHVYATGAAVSTMYATEQNSPQAESARAAVERNSRTLIQLVESLEGEALGKGGSGRKGTSRGLPGPDTPPPTSPPANPADKGKGKDGETPSPAPTFTEPPFHLDDYDFGKSWREHVDLLTQYALAARGENTADEKTARRELDTWALQAGQYFREITHGRISSSAVRADLGDYLDAITGAIEGIAGKDGESFVALREGADQMPEVTQRLAAGLAAATDRKGSVYDKAAELRNQLTATMTGHSYLAVMSFQLAFAQPGKAGLVSAQYRRVQVSLDDNSKQIAAQVRELGGPIKEAEFLQGWRIHLRDLENYARSLQAGDLTGRRTATDALNTYLGTVTKFLGNLTKGAIDPANADKRLRAQLAAMIGVVDALLKAFPSG
ncbi:MAG TPA: hypothetical protein VMZ00_13195 [Sporichthya sp.]|nr:hypothetical protein [Sporichthya sp.]